MTAKIKIHPTTKAIVSFAKRTQAKMTAALEKAYRKMYPDKSDVEIAAVVEETIRESEPSEAEMAEEDVRHHTHADEGSAAARFYVHRAAALRRLEALQKQVDEMTKDFNDDGAQNWGFVGSMEKLSEDLGRALGEDS